MALPVIPYIVMIGGVAVKYATKKLAEAIAGVAALTSACPTINNRGSAILFSCYHFTLCDQYLADNLVVGLP